MLKNYRQKACNTSYESLRSPPFSAPKKQAQMPVFRPLVLAKLSALFWSMLARFGVRLKDKALL